MSEEKNLYVDELSSEEKELLEIGKKIRDGGQNPVNILKYFLELQGTLKKTAEMGKQAQDFFMKKWEEFEKNFKEGKKP